MRISGGWEEPGGYPNSRLRRRRQTPSAKQEQQHEPKMKFILWPWNPSQEGSGVLLPARHCISQKGGEKSGWRSTRVCNQIIYQKSRNYYEWIFTNSFSTFARTRQRNLPNKRQQKHLESCSPCMQSGCSCSSSSSSFSSQIPNPDPFQPAGCVDFPAFWRHAPFVYFFEMRPRTNGLRPPILQFWLCKLLSTPFCSCIPSPSGMGFKLGVGFGFGLVQSRCLVFEHVWANEPPGSYQLCVMVKSHFNSTKLLLSSRSFTCSTIIQNTRSTLWCEGENRG